MLMDTSEIDTWTQQVVERLRSGGQLEDRRVELKREWPKADSAQVVRTARQLAGLANANYPEHVLWIVGIDERARQIIGADSVETASWWAAVGSCFDGDPPDLADVVVTVDGCTLVALCFGTTGAPYVVKNPQYGSSGHVIASEVPWRDGTSVRTIRKQELKALLMPRVVLPDILVHSASLDLFRKEGTDGQLATWWNGSMVWSVESLVPKRLTLPVRSMSLVVEFLDVGFSAPVNAFFRDARELASSDGSPDVRYVGDYIIIDGPGIIETMLMIGNETVPPAADTVAVPAAVTLTMPGPGLASPLIIRADLHPETPTSPGQVGRWRL
jgi:hypothetical protein